VNRKILAILLVVTLISISVPAAFADISTIDDIRCQELPSPIPCDVTSPSADVQFMLDTLGIPSPGAGTSGIPPFPPGVPGPSSETLATIFAIPIPPPPGPLEPPITTTEITFKALRDTGTFQYVFFACNASTVAGFNPVTDKQGWAVACISDPNLITIFVDGPTVEDLLTGDTFTITSCASGCDVAPGDLFFFGIIPNNSVGNFLANPSDFYNADGSPVLTPNSNRAPLFQLDIANPGEFDQLLSFIGGGQTLFTWEDLTRAGGSDQDFTDLAFGVDTEFIPPCPEGLSQLECFCELVDPENELCPFIGGELSPIDTTALLVAGATSPIAWYMYAFTALGIGALWFARNPYNVRNVKTIMGDYLDRFRKTD